ncbi:MAG: hypothetical protein ABSH41_07075 [Syntrophobacteraceae bacterium]|jgi:hypothetical protein
MDVPIIKPGKNADVELLKSVDTITRHAKNQIDVAWGAYKITATLLTMIFVFGIGIFGYLNYKSLHDMRQDLNEKVESMWREVNSKVEARLDDEFKPDKIGGLVARKAEERVDKVTEDIINNRVNGMITNKLQPVENRLETAKSNIESLMNINRMAFEARLGEVSSYITINDISLDSSNQLSDIAKITLKELEWYYATVKYSTVSYYYLHPITHKPYRATAEDIYILMSNDAYHNRIEAVNQTVEFGNDRKYFVEDLVNLTKDNNIIVRLRAANALEQLTNEYFTDHPMYNSISEWWETTGKHNNKYKSNMHISDEIIRLLREGSLDNNPNNIKSDFDNLTGFCKTRSIMADIYVERSELEQAKIQWQRIGNECDGQVEPLMKYAQLLVKEGNRQLAINILGKVKSFTSDFKMQLERYHILDDLKDEQQLKILMNSDSK